MSSMGPLSNPGALTPHIRSLPQSSRLQATHLRVGSSWGSGSGSCGIPLHDKAHAAAATVADQCFGVAAPRAIKAGPSTPAPQDGSAPKRRRGRPRKRAPLTDSSPDVIPKRGGSDGRTPSFATTTLDSPQTARTSWGKFECRRPVPCSVRVKSHSLCSGCINVILDQQKQQQDSRVTRVANGLDLPPFAQDDWSHEEPICGPLPDLQASAASAVAQSVQIGGVTFHRGKQSEQSSEEISLPRTFQGLLSMYVSVREEIQSWSDFFKANHGRRPQMSDVVDTRIPWLVTKFQEYLRVRDRVESEARLSVRKAALYAGAKGRFALTTKHSTQPGPSSVKVHSSGWNVIAKGQSAGPIKAWGTPGLVPTLVSLDEVDEWMFSLFDDPDETSQQRQQSPAKPKSVQGATSRSRSAKDKLPRQEEGRGLRGKSVGAAVDASCPLLDSAAAQATISSAKGPLEEQWERLGFSTGREKTPSSKSRAIAASSAWENLRSQRSEELTLPPDLFSDALPSPRTGGVPPLASRPGVVAHRDPGVLGTKDVLGVEMEGSAECRFHGPEGHASEALGWAADSSFGLESWPIDGFRPQSWASLKAKDYKALARVLGKDACAKTPLWDAAESGDL